MVGPTILCSVPFSTVYAFACFEKNLRCMTWFCATARTQSIERYPAAMRLSTSPGSSPFNRDRIRRKSLTILNSPSSGPTLHPSSGSGTAFIDHDVHMMTIHEHAPFQRLANVAARRATHVPEANYAPPSGHHPDICRFAARPHAGRRVRPRTVGARISELPRSLEPV
jgi:hypothetical protein